MLKINDIKEIATDDEVKDLHRHIIELGNALGKIEDETKQLSTIMAACAYMIVTNGYDFEAITKIMADVAGTKEMDDIINEYIGEILWGEE